VDDTARAVLLRVDLPDFLDARFECLRVRSLEIESLDQLLGQRSTHAFTENGDFGEDVHAGSESRLPLSFPVDTHVAGSNAHDAPAFDQETVPCESRIDVDAGSLGPFRQPLRHAVE
jgi:hypothetical protein